MSNLDTGLHYPIDLKNIPAAWTAAYIADLAIDIQSGFACGAHNSDANGVAHLRPMNVSREGTIELGDLRYVPAKYDARRLARGDVLFNNTNSPELIGKTALVSLAGDGLAFSNHMTRLRFNDAVDARYAAAQLHYLWRMKYFLHGCVKHVNQASVSSKELARTVVLVVPPINEQRRIVAKIEELFSELDKGVESLQTAREQLKVYRQAVLKHAFEGKLTAKWREKNRDKLESGAKKSFSSRRMEPVSAGESLHLASLPSGWTYVRLGDYLASIEAGKSFKCDERQPSPEEIGVAKVSAVSWGVYNEAESKTCIDAAKVNPQFFIKPGDFLLSRANTIELVGACVIAKNVTQQIMLSDKTLRLSFDAGIQDYALHYLRSQAGRNEIMERSTGNQESMRNIGQERIRNIIFPVCHELEIAQVVQLLEATLAHIEAIDMSITEELLRSQSLRQSILKRAFSGQLVAQDPNDEPAAVLLDRIRAEKATQTKTGKKSQTLEPA
jgi:type I restriction enzyme, S subunit